MALVTGIGKLGLAAIGLFFALAAAHAETYPARPIALVVIGPPGGPTDQAGRLVAQNMAKRLGQPVVVENKPGAGGNLAAEYVVRAKADGYTIFLGGQGPIAANQFLYSNLRINPEKDFVPVHGLLTIPNVILVNASSPFRTLKDLVDQARKNPGSLAAGTAGIGLGGHMALERLQSVADLKVMHVPYKGSALLLNNLLGGHVHMAFDYVVGTEAHVQAGKLRALAVMGPKRLAILPDVPTIREAGYPLAESGTWMGMFFASGTPVPIVERWRSELEQMVKEPRFVEAIARSMGALPLDISGAEFGAYVEADRQKMKEFIAKTGVRAE